eukprot:1260125-Karenia_brevis.AAC.1
MPSSKPTASEVEWENQVEKDIGKLKVRVKEESNQVDVLIQTAKEQKEDIQIALDKMKAQEKAIEDFT